MLPGYDHPGRTVARRPGRATRPVPDPVTTEPAGWVQVVRNSPYWVSQGVHQNILTIRRWVLGESGYCSNTDRHILFDMRGRFLGYMDNGDTRAETQQRINNLRTTLVTRGEVDQQVPGAPDTTGYPFALACDQPHVDLPEAMARYLGTLPGDRIWGRGMTSPLPARTNPGRCTRPSTTSTAPAAASNASTCQWACSG